MDKQDEEWALRGYDTQEGERKCDFSNRKKKHLKELFFVWIHLPLRSESSTKLQHQNPEGEREEDTKHRPIRADVEKTYQCDSTAGETLKMFVHE